MSSRQGGDDPEVRGHTQRRLSHCPKPVGSVSEMGVSCLITHGEVRVHATTDHIRQL